MSSSITQLLIQNKSVKKSKPDFSDEFVLAVGANRALALFYIA